MRENNKANNEARNSNIKEQVASIKGTEMVLNRSLALSWGTIYMTRSDWRENSEEEKIGIFKIGTAFFWGAGHL